MALQQQTGGAYRTVMSRLDATVAPTVNDDVTLGYAAGSLWIDEVAGKAYLCLDATAEAAVWLDLASGGGGGGAASFSRIFAMMGA